MNSYVKGFLMTLIGVIILTPDSLLIRLTDADFWTISFWRGLLSGCVLFLGLLVWYRGKLLSVFKFGYYEWVSVVNYAIGNILFVYAINTTSVAHVLIIISTIPFFAAIASRLFLHEKIALLTLISIAVSLVGIVLIAYESLIDQTQSITSIWGDLAALISAICFAVSLLLTRMKESFNPLPSLCLSGFMVAAISWFFASTLFVPTSSWLPLGLMGMIVMPVSFALIFFGPRYIPAPEVGLLMLIETFFGPIWVWIGVGEYPGTLAFIGGAIILSMLIINNTLQIAKKRNKFK